MNIKIYKYNTLEEAINSIDLMNNYWGFKNTPESTLYFSYEYVNYNEVEGYWWIVYNEWSLFLGQYDDEITFPDEQ